MKLKNIPHLAWFRLNEQAKKTAANEDQWDDDDDLTGSRAINKPNSIQKENNNELVSGQPRFFCENLAPKFKHQMNCCQRDIAEIRRLLVEERQSQTMELQEFFSSEFKRLMSDDWLISRFLLRGQKEALRLRHKLKQGLSDEEQLIWSQTMRLIGACANFKLQYEMGPQVRLSEFPLDWVEREGILLGDCDRNGNSTIYMRCKLHRPKLVETPEARHQVKRLMLLYLDQCDQQLINRPGSAICCVFDMSEASLENLDLELLAWMVSSFKQCSPKLLAYVIIYNLPWLFNATFRLLTSSLLSRTHAQSLRFVYGSELLHYVDHQNLPKYLQESLAR